MPEKDDLRNRAEELLAGRGEHETPASSEDVQSMIHELQVHQIELELQNEELRRAQHEIEESRERFSDLYDFAPVGYFTFDSNGTVREVNLPGALLLGVKRSRLIGSSFLLYLAGDNRDVFRTHLDQVAATEEKHSCELRIERMKGGPIDASLESIRVSVAPGEPSRIRTAVTDMTERVAVNRARLQMLTAVSTYSQSTDELTQVIIDQIESVTGSKIGFYHFVEPDQETLSLQGWSTNTLSNMCKAEGKGQHYPISEAGVWVDCVKERRPVIHNDYASLPHRKGMPEGHAPVTRELVVPVIRAEKVVAIIGVGNKSSDYSQKDVETVSSLGDLSWEMVERMKTEESLRQSEDRYRFLFENMLDGLAYCRMLYENGSPTDFVYLAVNNSFETLTGLQNAVDKKVSELIPGIRKSSPELFEIYGRVAMGGQPERFETYVAPLTKWFMVSVFSPAKEYFVAVFDDITERKLAEAELMKREEMSRNVASMLQDALMPSVPVRHDVEIGLCYRGASSDARLGGDFYDFIDLADGRLAIVIGDVCGKGLEAAKSTAMVKYMLRAYINDCSDPGDCLTRLNQALADQIDMEKFVTIGLAVLDSTNWSVQYSSAGHPPPVFINHGVEALQLKQGVPLGVIADFKFGTVIKSIAAEDRIVIYTDGLLEARPKGGEPFGKKHLIREIKSGRKLKAQVLCEKLVNSAFIYSDNTINDDIAVIVIKV